MKQEPEGEAGIAIVATPIGNLEDITLRAKRLLETADLVICEDTRRTMRLLNHLELRKPLESCHAHTAPGRVAALVERIAAQGLQAIFVTDGGTPGVSDPGAALVREARRQGVHVYPVPGPSALAGALSVSGFASNGVFFCGFLPLKPGKRKKALLAAATIAETIVCYESPFRVLALLGDIGEIFPAGEVFIAREMTKMHEEYLIWTIGEPLPDLMIKGEFTLVLHVEKKINFSDDCSDTH